MVGGYHQAFIDFHSCIIQSLIYGFYYTQFIIHLLWVLLFIAYPISIIFLRVHSILI